MRANEFQILAVAGWAVLAIVAAMTVWFHGDELGVRIYGSLLLVSLSALTTVIAMAPERRRVR